MGPELPSDDIPSATPGPEDDIPAPEDGTSLLDPGIGADELLEAGDGEPGDDPAAVLPLAIDLDAPLPALREVSVKIVKLAGDRVGESQDAEGESMALLQDPQGLAPKPLVLPMWAYALAAMFDGCRNALTISEDFADKFGHVIPPEQILDLQRQLDEALFLFSETLERTLKRQMQSYLGDPNRRAAHAGTSYPAEAQALTSTLESFFAAPDGPGKLERDIAPPERDTVRALMLPHIDLNVGGATYAHGYAELLRGCDADLFVILGVAHQAPGTGLYYISRKDFETPLGLVHNERGISERLQAAAGGDPAISELAHRTEHSVEFQAVWLQALLAGRCRRNFTIVPVLCGPIEILMAAGLDGLDAAPFKNFAAALREQLDASGRPWCVIGSVDLSHVGPEFQHSTAINERMLPPIERGDRRFLSALERLDSRAAYNEIARTDPPNSRNIDAVTAMLTLLESCRGVLASGRLLHYDQLLKDATQSAVSFASMVFESRA